MKSNASLLKSNSGLRNLMYVAVVLFLVCLDLISKEIAAKFMHLGQSISLIPNIFNLTLVHNPGAAFGIGAAWSRSIFYIMSFVALFFLIAVFAKTDKKDKLTVWSFLLILSGAIGNIIDRVRLGYVIDFLDVYWKSYHWPAFNLADAFITVGAVLLALGIFESDKKLKASE